MIWRSTCWGGAAGKHLLGANGASKEDGECQTCCLKCQTSYAERGHFIPEETPADPQFSGTCPQTGNLSHIPQALFKLLSLGPSDIAHLPFTSRDSDSCYPLSLRVKPCRFSKPDVIGACARYTVPGPRVPDLGLDPLASQGGLSHLSYTSSLWVGTTLGVWFPTVSHPLLLFLHSLLFILLAVEDLCQYLRSLLITKV